jgi:hypothetical protein
MPYLGGFMNGVLISNTPVSFETYRTDKKKTYRTDATGKY